MNILPKNINKDYDGEFGDQVYNGKVRLIQDFDDFSFIEFDGKISLGVDIVGSIKFINEYIIDVNAGIGVVGQGSIIIRFDNTMCIDINAYIYLILRLLDYITLG